MANTKKYVSLAKLTKYDELIKAKIAADDAAILKSAQDYADGLAGNYEASGSVNTAKQELQGKIDALANGAVAQNTAAIAKLNGAGEGSVAKAIADAKALIDADVDAVEGDIADLGAYVGEIPSGYTQETVIAYINKKAEETLSAAQGGSSETAASVKAQLDTYKTENDARVLAVEGDVSDLKTAVGTKASQADLDAVSGVANAAVKQSDYDVKVAALEAEDERIAGLVSAEVDRATEVEADFETRISAMEVFWDTTKEPDAVVDTLKEIQNYIASDESGASAMAGSIQKNADDIAALDTAYKAADVTLQANIDKKADSTTVDGIASRVGALETASATHALKTEVEAVSTALTEYKDAHAGDYTNTQIDAKIKVNTDAIAALGDTYATDAELAAAIEAEVSRSNGAYAAKSLEQTVADHKADTVSHVTADDKAKWNASEQNAKDYADGLNNTMTTKVDGAISRIGANETAISGLQTAVGTKAAQSDLDAAVLRIAANETAIANFVEVSESEINALFGITE